MKLEFKKVSKDCYYVSNETHSVNMFTRYSDVCKHYEIDIAGFYFEEKTLKKAKEKIEKYWLENKFTELFEK